MMRLRDSCGDTGVSPLARSGDRFRAATQLGLGAAVARGGASMRASDQAERLEV